MSISRAHNTTLQPSFTKPGTYDLFPGSGIPATAFDTATDSVSHIKLGLQAHLRGGGVIMSTTVLPDGAVVVVPSGPDPNAPTRAPFNWDYSVGLTNGGNLATALGSHDIWMSGKYDGNIFLQAKMSIIDMAPAGSPSHNYVEKWLLNGDPTKPFITDDGGNPGPIPFVKQNSENPAFFKALIDATIPGPHSEPDPNGPTGSTHIVPGGQPYAFQSGHTMDIYLTMNAPGTAQVDVLGVTQMVEHLQFNIV